MMDDSENTKEFTETSVQKPDEDEDVMANSQGSQGRQNENMSNIGVVVPKINIIGAVGHQNRRDVQSTVRTNVLNDSDNLNNDVDLGFNDSHIQRTNDLLQVGDQQDKFDQVLQQLYFSKHCQYFYIMLMIIGSILVITTIVDGFLVAHSPTFIAVELLLNITISVDFYFRTRIYGFKNYIAKDKWNKLDFCIVLGCNILFLVLMAHNSNVYEEEIEVILLVLWSITQSLRMLVIAKKQRQAINSAKTLIDFSNLGDIELEQNNFHRSPQKPSDLQNFQEEEIVFQNPMNTVSSVNPTRQSIQSKSTMQSFAARKQSLKERRKMSNDDDEDYSPRMRAEEAQQERTLEIKELDNDESYNNDMSLNTDRYAL